MIIVLKTDLTEEKLQRVSERIESEGFYTRSISQYGKLLLSVDGPNTEKLSKEVTKWQDVEGVIDGHFPYYLASRKCHKSNSVIRIGKGDNQVTFGDKEIPVIAGPCAIETAETALAIAEKVKAAGVKIFRGMLFNEADLVAEHTDIFQIGTRNMSNFQLLKYVGQVNKPVILKRGMGSNIVELLCAAEYILSYGNPNVILCERGIRTFEQFTRFGLDIAAIPSVKELSHLPIIIDPSHASGKSSLVSSLTMAGIAAGADGVILEVHDKPEKAFSDGTESITPSQLKELIKMGKKVALAVDRKI